MTEGFVIRAATVHDVPDMVVVERASFSDPWPSSAFVDLLHAKHASIRVLVDDHDRAIGYCVLLTAADEGEIANLAIAVAFRRQGLASTLLLDTIATARRRGGTTIYLEVRASNVAAQSLYSTHQFIEVGRRKGYYQKPREDALILRWQDASGS